MNCIGFVRGCRGIIDVLFRHLPEGLRENHEKHEPGLSVSRLKF